MKIVISKAIVRNQNSLHEKSYQNNCGIFIPAYH